MTKLHILSIASVTLALGVAAVSCTSGSSDTSTSPPAQAGDLNKGASRIAQVVTQVNLVSDVAGTAITTDPNLINAWGLAFNPSGIAWVSATETGLSQVYDSESQLVTSITIPGVGGESAKPTGQVFNSDCAAFMGDRFIFVTENGTIAGWQPTLGRAAVMRIDDSSESSVYKGVALANVGEQLRLYVTDFHDAEIEVYDSSYQRLTVPGAFEDPNLPAGYAPFNVYAYGNMLFVSYAKPAAPEMVDDQPGAGRGIVNLFDMEGRLITRLISHGQLDSPWGMAVAPRAYGSIGQTLLVGNFGDGRINVYALIQPASDKSTKQKGGSKQPSKQPSPDEPSAPSTWSAQFLGILGTDEQTPLVIDGLWALVFAPEAGGFHANDLYFTAGPDDERHGLYGRIELPTALVSPADESSKPGKSSKPSH